MAFTYKRANPNEDKNVVSTKAALDQLGDYKSSDVALAARQKAEDNYNNRVSLSDWGDGGEYGAAVQNALNKINNREKFSYDLNGDALYQQYKDQYITGGKLAMADTMGQAAALTGGYGNSYAATAGNQAYQGYLQKLNDVVPQLYQMAVDRYNQEGQDLKDQYSIAQQMYNTKYGELADRVSEWQSMQDMLDSKAYNLENQSFDQWSTKHNMLQSAYDTALGYATNEANTAYNNAFGEYQQSQNDYWNQKNYELDKAKADQSDLIASLQAKIGAYEDDGIVLPKKTTNADNFASGLVEKGIWDRGLLNTQAYREKYGTYDDYVSAMILEGMDKKKLTESEAKYLYKLYQLD